MTDNCAIPREPEYVNLPNAKTLAEQLDAARTGEEFGAILMRLFAARPEREVDSNGA